MEDEIKEELEKRYKKWYMRGEKINERGRKESGWTS